jgi:O-methyltransferase
MRWAPVDRERRAEGMDWPLSAATMIGLRRLDNLRACVERIVEEDVPGDLIETGVWRGGASIFMRGALEAFGDRERTVWVADSFQGLPKPDPEKYPCDEGIPCIRNCPRRVRDR